MIRWKSDYEPHGYWYFMNCLRNCYKWYEICGSFGDLLKVWISRPH